MSGERNSSVISATAAAHVTVGLFLWILDGSLLCLELLGDREANWVESVWTHGLPGTLCPPQHCCVTHLVTHLYGNINSHVDAIIVSTCSQSQDDKEGREHD